MKTLKIVVIVFVSLVFSLGSLDIYEKFVLDYHRTFEDEFCFIFCLPYDYFEGLGDTWPNYNTAHSHQWRFE